MTFCCWFWCWHTVVQRGRFLGGVIGDQAGVEAFTKTKVCKWQYYVELLSSIAVDQPQLAYVALTRSLQFEWILSQRVTPNCNHLFGVLEEALTKNLYPHL